MYVNKTVEVNITWDEKGRDYFCGAICGWNLASDSDKQVGAEEGFGGDLSFYVDDKMSNEQLKRLFSEAEIDFNKLTVCYYSEDLQGVGKELERCINILDAFSLLDFVSFYLTDNNMEIEIPFKEMEKFEVILKEFKIMG